MRRAAPWITCLALGLVLAQRESVVHSPDGSLAPLTFGRPTCLRVVQGERALSGTTCVDFGESGAGVLKLPLSEGTLEVPYRVEPALGEVSYLIRLGGGWRAASPAAQVLAEQSAKPAALDTLVPPAPAGADSLAGRSTSVHPGADSLSGQTASAAVRPGADSLAGPAEPVRPETDSLRPPMADSLRDRLLPGYGLPPSQPGSSPSVNGLPPSQPGIVLPAANPQADPPRDDSLAGRAAPVHPRTDSSPLPYFFLRQVQGRYQVAYSLLARAPVDTPASGIRLFLDGKPLVGQLTRRTTASVPGHLERGQAEYGWIDLGPLQGSRLRLTWQLGEGSLEREWRLP
ncbi:MAG: hypothetical protein K6T35_00350 [Meiothermus silvanus]|nr:hypothetical protein [Allomeiothermus silvanus]